LLVPSPVTSPDASPNIEPAPASSISLTVIIPVRDSAAYLTECLEALRNSTISGFECIVVDDGSTDNSVEVARSYGADVIANRQPEGPAAARNRGARAANTELLFFIDADVCVHSDTVERIVSRFAADPKLDAVIGSYDEAPADPGFISQYKNLMGCYFHQGGKHDASTFWTGCGGIRRSAMLEFGGFNERYSRPCIEDIELGRRMIAAGRHLALDPLIRVKHLKSWTLPHLIKSDIFDRALPWTRLILRENHIPNDLNLRHREKFSVIFTWLAQLSLVISIDHPIFLILVAFCIGITLSLQSEFWRFFAARKGWGFALAAMPVHLLYFSYSGLAFAAGLLLHVSGERAPEEQPVPGPSILDRVD